MSNKTLEQLLREHLQWTSTTFPKGTSIGALLHAEREIKEVRDDIFLGMSFDKKREEYADVLGCIFDSMNREGITVENVIEAWDKKLQVNKSRKWKDNGDGSYSHIKE